MSSLLGASLGFIRGLATAAGKRTHVGAGCVARPAGLCGRAPGLHLPGRSSGKGRGRRVVGRGGGRSEPVAKRTRLHL